MSNSSPIIYIKAEKHTILRRPQVTLGDVASILCADEQLLQKIKKLPLYQFPDKSNAKNPNANGKNISKSAAHDPAKSVGNNCKNRKKTSDNTNAQGADSQMEFFTILRVISLIQASYPQAQIENLGEQDFIVEYQTKQPAPPWVNHCKVALLCIVIFFGSAFTIMAFNNDISVTEIFTRFYEQLMGQEKPAVSELEIAYSIGLAVGILVFFNHFGRRKFSLDPTPIQVEVNKFTSDCDDTLIENASQRGHEEDAS